MDMATQTNGKKAKRTRTAAAKVDFRTRFMSAMKQLDETFVMRREAIECVAIAYLTGKNTILIGDPGTGKTRLIDCFNSHFEAVKTFKILCGSFTTLDELVGPTDIAKYKAGEWARVWSGLPQCNIGFCDEVMKMNDGAMNSCLELFNERTLNDQPTELWSVVSATNWPEVKSRSEKVAALYDRFTIRCHVLEVLKHGNEEERLKLLDAVDAVEQYKPTTRFTLDELKEARSQIKRIAFPADVNKVLDAVQMRLRKEGIEMTSRRAGQMKLLCRALAWLDGRDEVEVSDLTALRYGAWDDEEQIAPATAIVDSLDQETVRNCIRLIDQGRKAFSNYVALPRERQFAQSDKTVKEMQRCANAVEQELKAKPVTKRSLERIQAAAAEMIGEYDRLAKMVAELHGLDMGDDVEEED